ncbi:MAG TPA: selenocysteine-specific translation elongation factor [Candidatus Sulfotelmatobacter sp.]|nr:selenocysteine-specific translation elongation factor [Candidatus Sulfotelmatobacter sp.]
MIIATAGHIDHGKTALIKAITGVDTAHLPEERKRGLTIDLGFAAWSLPGGGTVGFVDVPGHERFVRNMLSGVTGIDFALLVIAVDDGVMPQTREHLEILDLLGIRHGAVALTKIDRAAPERIAAVRADVADLLAPTTLAGAPMLEVSALENIGVDALKAHVAGALAACPARPDAGHFRLSIDRCFTVDGAGLVVTGTVANGRVAVGDRLTLLPGGQPVRVRGLHGHHRAVTEARAGERCAVNIVAPEVDRDGVSRGDWLAAAEIGVAVDRLDVRVRTPRAGARLRQDTPVHLHHGAADVTGRLILLEGSSLEPGAHALAQLALDRPVHALTGDRFVLRDRAAARTVAGGRVLDPFVPSRGRRLPARLARLRALEADDAASALAGVLAAEPDGVDLGRFAIAANLPATDAERLRTDAALITFVDRERTFGVAAAAWHAAREAVLGALDGWHRAHPDAVGATAAELRQARPAAIGRRSFAAALDALIGEGAVARDGQQLRRPERRPALAGAELAAWQRIEPLITGRPPPTREVAQAAGLELAALERLLNRAARVGLATRVAPNRFFPRTAIAQLAATAEALAAEAPNGTFDAARFRDRSALGRNLTIEVLEFFDKAGFTRRVGDARRIVKPAADIFGPLAG